MFTFHYATSKIPQGSSIPFSQVIANCVITVADCKYVDHKKKLEKIHITTSQEKFYVEKNEITSVVSSGLKFC